MKTDPTDYSILDRPEVLMYLFHPRPELGAGASPESATDISIPVETDVAVGARFHMVRRESPNILFFHGNGEVAADYDCVAPFYTDIGINLFVADYRGYGRSGGSPSFSAMIDDARTIYAYFLNFLKTVPTRMLRGG